MSPSFAIADRERRSVDWIAVVPRCNARLVAIWLDLTLHGGDFETLGLNAQTKAAEAAHVEIRDPDQGKSRNEVAAPIGKEKLIASDDEKKKGYVMAEAVLAGENIEKFARIQATTTPALIVTKLAWLTEHFLMGNRPRDASDRNGQNEKLKELARQRGWQGILPVNAWPGPARADWIARHLFDANRLPFASGIRLTM
jgi:hypothetical protein